jgi:hypothetical protein
MRGVGKVFAIGEMRNPYTEEDLVVDGIYIFTQANHWSLFSAKQVQSIPSLA